MFNEFLDMLPEGGLPLIGMRTIMYLNEEGETKYKFSWSGEASSIEVIGLLEMLKGELIVQTIKNRDGSV